MFIALLNKTIWLLLVVVLIAVSASYAVAFGNVTDTDNDVKPGCQRQCGTLNITYPFGISPDCSFSPSYSLSCDESYNPPRAFTTILNSSSTSFRVLNISDSQIHVSSLIAYNCPPPKKNFSTNSVKILAPSHTPFTVSDNLNDIWIVGSCDYHASFLMPNNESSPMAYNCFQSCFKNETKYNFQPKGCSNSNGCCHKFPGEKNLKRGFSLKIDYNKFPRNDSKEYHTPCGYIVFGMKDSFEFRNISDFSDETFVGRTKDSVPMVAEWMIGNQPCTDALMNGINYACQQNSDCINGTTGGYRCGCRNGYEGNPYLSPGCRDKNECLNGTNPCHERAICSNTPGGYNCSCIEGYHGDGFQNNSGCYEESKPIQPDRFKLFLGLSLGFLFVLAIGTGTNMLIRKRKLAKIRKQFFKENGGLILMEKLSFSNIGSSYNSFRLFTMEQLKKATKNFNKDLIVGIGGYGTVYKGTLRDGTLVAVKISKVVDNTQIEQFINEMVILTQIHHRNVVKLLGSCLEAEIPILVYEFVAKGSLLEHIHSEANWLTWTNRLRIATETATALGYLHSAASTPIIHRDIKSANILLDENYGAKISDFGASRLIPMDKTQMSTLVQGTLGYMDPDYLLSSQLTDKSDVYSFGVVVAELLTGEKALSTERRVKDRNLAKYFVTCLTNGQLLDIIDPQIVDEAPEQQLMYVAKIVQECLSRKGAKRPMMKDVAVQLAGLQRKETEQYQNRNPWIEGVRDAWNNRSNSIADFSFSTTDGR